MTQSSNINNQNDGTAIYQKRKNCGVSRFWWEEGDSGVFRCSSLVINSQTSDRK